MITVGESKAVIVKGDYTPVEMWSGKSRNLIHVPELNFTRPVLNANYPALSRALNQLDRSRPYRLWYKLDTDGSGGTLGKRAYVHAYYADPALKPEKLTENGQEFYIKGELNSILIYGSNEEDATYNRFYDFCLTADGSDPREYTPPNEGTKISGWHEEKTGVPSVVEGTYNNTVEIMAKGQSFQQTYEATEQQSGSLVQMEITEGQPIDVVVNIEAKQDGEPSPENPAAIEGTNKVNLTVCGRNLLAPNVDKYLYDSMETRPLIRLLDLVDVKRIIKTMPGRSFLLTATVEVKKTPEDVSTRTPKFVMEIGLNSRFKQLIMDKTRLNNPGTYHGVSDAIEISENDIVTHPIWFYLSGCVGYEIEVRDFGFEVNYDGTYRKYSGNTYMITLPETSYGGYVDWTRKKYVQTHRMMILDSSLDWKRERGQYYTAFEGIKNGEKDSCCSHFVYRNTNDLAISGTYRWGGTGDAYNPNLLFAYDAGVELIDGFKAFLDTEKENDTPVTVVYELAEPIEYDLSDQITDEPTASFDGITTVYSDQASVTVNGAAVPSPFHPSEMIPSSSIVKSSGYNLLRAYFQRTEGVSEHGIKSPRTLSDECFYKGLSCSNYFAPTNIDMTIAENSIHIIGGFGYGLGLPMKCKPQTQYVIRYEADSHEGRASAAVAAYDSEGTFLSILTWSGGNPCRVTTPDRAAIMTVIMLGAKTASSQSSRYEVTFHKLWVCQANYDSNRYIPYYPATQVEIPQLRAIPGTTARDELIPAEGQPGWYDVIRNIGVLETKDCVWHPFSSTNFTSWYCCPFQNRVRPKVKLDIKPGETLRATAPLACNIATCYWDAAIDKLTQMRTQNAQSDANRLYWFNDFKEFGDEALAYLQSLWDNSGGVVWYEQVEPTVERIYLGNLKTYPRYTILSSNGQLLPDITATVKMSD